MTEKLQRPSAKIYAFPARGRTAASMSRGAPESAGSVQPVEPANIVFGSGWYHDVAVQDAEVASKR